MELAHKLQPGHGIHAFLHGLQIRVVLSTELDYGSPRVRAYNEERNQMSLEDVVDQLEEALLRAAKYHALRC